MDFLPSRIERGSFLRSASLHFQEQRNQMEFLRKNIFFDIWSFQSVLIIVKTDRLSMISETEQVFLWLFSDQ